MLKSARGKGRTAESFTIHLAVSEHKPPFDFHFVDELCDDNREDLRKMLFDDFPRVLQRLADSPHVSRPWDHPIDTIGPMRR
jgi:hypothetical protein